MNIEEKTKLAHEYFLRFSNTTVEDAWKYADNMEKQAEQRTPKGFPEAIKESGYLKPPVRPFLKSSNSNPLKPEVDWSQAPDWANYYAIVEGKHCFWLTHDIPIEKGIEAIAEYQPPATLTWHKAPSFGFTGSHVVERPNV